MKKTFSILCLVLILAACKKKQDDYILTAGKTKGLKITEHNLSIQTSYTDSSTGTIAVTEILEIDIDSDGTNDIRGVSYDQMHPPSGHYYEASIDIINPEFIFPEQANSGNRSGLLIDVVDDQDGTFPKRTYIYEIFCGTLPNSTSYNIANTPKFMMVDEHLNSGDYVWENSTLSKLNLKRSAYTAPIISYPSANNDSLICNEYNFHELCATMPENETIYLPFLRQKNGDNKYGWLEISLIDNKICFIQSAIQE